MNALRPLQAVTELREKSADEMETGFWSRKAFIVNEASVVVETTHRRAMDERRQSAQRGATATCWMTFARRGKGGGPNRYKVLRQTIDRVSAVMLERR